MEEKREGDERGKEEKPKESKEGGQREEIGEKREGRGAVQARLSNV